jgi:hypothetical protein
VSAEAVRRSPAAPAMTASQPGTRFEFEEVFEEPEGIDASSSVFMATALLRPSCDICVSFVIAIE